MLVYNQEKTSILTEYDLRNGYLKDDTITITEEEVQAVKEEGHFEIIKEYPTGGKDMKWVVDKQAVEYSPARTYTKNIKVYIPYTVSEIKKLESLNEIQTLKNWFSDTYTYQEQKYRRLHTLGFNCDDGEKPYTKLMSLYAEAETKRKRIQELEGVAYGSN